MSPATLEDIRAQAERAQLTPVVLEDGDSLSMFCPVCREQQCEVHRDGEYLKPQCSNGCDPSRIADKMHRLSGDGRARLYPSEESVEAAGNGRVARVRSGADIKPRAVYWLVPQRVALGKVNILGGVAGQGKSQLACNWGGGVSRGALAGALHGHPANVLIVSAEDDPEDTIVPRLMAVGADMSRVHLMDMRQTVNGRAVPSTVKLPDDAPAVIDEMAQRCVRLLILDPVAALLAQTHNAHNNQQVRHGLELIKSAAEEYECAVLLVTHLRTKADPGTDTLGRMTDSHAFVGLPRSVMFLTPHPDDPEGERGSRKLLTVTKGNLVRAGEHALELTIEGCTVGHDDQGTPVTTSRVVIGDEVNLTTAEGLMTGEQRSERQSAERFLREQLEDREAWATEVQAASKEEGITAKTLRSARERVAYHRKGGGNHSIWGLKDRLGDRSKPTDDEPVAYPEDES